MILMLDQSSYITGWAVFDGVKLHRYGSLILDKVEKEDYLGRSRNRIELINFIDQLVNKYGIDCIVLEGIFLNPSAKNTNPLTFATLAAIKGAVEDYCQRKGVYCFEYGTASTWRKILKFPFVIDKKRVKSDQFKEMAKEFSMEHWGLPDGLLPDLYEAVAMGSAYMKIFDTEETQ